jgi:hypothetical protein
MSFELLEHMVSPSITPLKRHPGHHGGLLALSLLAGAIVVVWTTSPKPNRAVEHVEPHAGTATKATDRTSLVPIELSPSTQIAVVGDRELSQEVSASGPVTFDESRTAHVFTPVAGWLSKRAHGRTVRAGDTLGVVHSLEVYVTTLDLIAQVRDFRSQAPLDELRSRLYRWGMRREMVLRIEQTMKPQAALPLIAAVSGTVVAERKLASPFVEPTAEDLYTITDPAYAWLYVEIPADDAELARVGMTARVTIEGITRPVSAPIGYISRRATDGKRTVRFNLHAAGLHIPPMVQAKVDLLLQTARGPAIVESAIIRDGERTFVYVVHDSQMEPREVKLGPSKDGQYLVSSGLAVGETIAVALRAPTPQ